MFIFFKVELMKYNTFFVLFRTGSRSVYKLVSMVNIEARRQRLLYIRQHIHTMITTLPNQENPKQNWKAIVFRCILLKYEDILSCHPTSTSTFILFFKQNLIPVVLRTHNKLLLTSIQNCWVVVILTGNNVQYTFSNERFNNNEHTNHSFILVYSL